MKITIIGSGWYGLHCYLFLKENNYDITLLEKNSDIFNNSSNFNQNRLHLGYHYPRSHKTRHLCIEGYYKFVSKYREVVDFIDHNYYLISNNSFIDYNTYLKIFSDINYQHNIIKNTEFNNIEGNIINTREKIINSEKSKDYFKSRINKDDIKLNYNVNKIVQKDNKVIINDELKCDLLIDCTYNQLTLSKKEYIYELTISLIYKRLNFNNNFESITVMDGNFFSLFPREISKQKYTLTHVKYTPLIKSSNIEDIHNYNLEDKTLKETIQNMENEVVKIYKDFKKDFEYQSYFTSYKCKLNCTNDSRECIIEQDNNIISVNCGKIIGIFEVEEYIQRKLNI
tara:strand:- start:11725 stop:12747 length:1023 start_codon:yes stop_codon:yes gene_type:complete